MPTRHALYPVQRHGYEAQASRKAWYCARHELKRRARDLDGIVNAGSSSARQRNTAVHGSGPRTALLTSLVIALLLGALSALVMFPAAQHLRSLRDGERIQATLHTSG